MLKTKRFIIVIIIYSFIFSFFYNYFVLAKFKPFTIKLKEVKNRSFILPWQDAYLLKVWGLKAARKVRFNQEIAQPFYFRERGELKESYFKLPSEIVNKGINKITIDGPTTYSVRVQNYVGKLETKEVFILFNSAAFFKNNSLSASGLILGAVFISFLLYGFWFFLSLLIKQLLGLSLKKKYSSYLLSYLPYLLILSIFYFLSILTPYRVITSSGFFITLSALLIGAIQAPIIIYQLSQEAKAQFKKLQESGFLDADKQSQIELSLALKRLLIFKQWHKNYKLGDKLIATSIALIIMFPLLWILTLTAMLDFLSNIAFLALLIGAVIKFVKLVKAKEAE